MVLFVSPACRRWRLTFSPKSPPPIGGSKLKPGYAAFKGPDAATLLTWIVTESYKTYWITRDPAILSFLAKSFNRILAMHQRGEKDALDERLMKGLKKAGHISWLDGIACPLLRRESSQELSGSVVSGYVSKRVLAIGTSSVSDTNCTVNPATNLPITLY
ncbi:hypothetical protein BC830DRAFT_89064 [Chytriomyces sp. MP71]|nr:hypothetical protein BC830DRAFT_89064 [Chytriomyces sp. MP71]